MATLKPASASRSESLSTGEVATLCSVTPDTVLKWIKAGKIPANRTAGGHHRIPRTALRALLDDHKPAPRLARNGGEELQYCWEFNSIAGRIPDGCKECIVYRSGALRCYEMSRLAPEAGHVGLFCDESCDECEYFPTVHGQLPNVLVVTNQDGVSASILADVQPDDFNVNVVDCEYRCSMMVEQFRPDFVVIDCSMGAARSYDFARLLHEDPRVPFVKVILVGDRADLPRECDKTVFALIGRRFTAATLSDIIQGARAPQQEPPWSDAVHPGTGSERYKREQ